jgi:hypothetical protein
MNVSNFDDECSKTQKASMSRGRAHLIEETHMTLASHSPLAISSERWALERRTDSDSEVIEGSTRRTWAL